MVVYLYIYIYTTIAGQTGWTDWADIFCEHSWVAVGCYRLKKLIFFFNGQRRALLYYNIIMIIINTAKRFQF